MAQGEVEDFVRVVRAGGFTAAARQLRVPKSTLSKRVARLEERLGVRLLQRTTRRVGLTEEGRAFFERCAPAVDALDAAERDVAAYRTRPRGTLVVACPFDFARDTLGPALPVFRERYPEIALQIRVGQHRVDLVGEGVDVALRAGHLDDSSLVARRLADSALWFVASPTYLARRGRPERLADLAGHDVLTFGVPPGGWPLDTPEGPARLTDPGWLSMNEFGVLAALAVQGCGIALLERHHLQRVPPGALERVLPGVEVGGGGLYAVFPTRENLAPRVRVFVDFLAEWLAGRGLYGLE